MIRHVVLFTWTPDTTDADVEALTRGLRTLPDRIPEIRAYDVGPNLGFEPSADFAIVADFDDRQGYETYRDHPEHAAVRDTLIIPRIAARCAVQYELAKPHSEPQ